MPTNKMLVFKLLATFKVSSFHTQLLLIQHLFETLGYRNLRILGRRDPKQSTDFGGHELASKDALGLFDVKTVVKFVRDKVRTRMLDELTGTIERVGADYGILIATDGLGELVATEHLKRIRVITGVELAALFATHKIGVANGTLDAPFFEALEMYAGQLGSLFNRVHR
jgi:restriction endonuclease Mrr